MFKITSNGWDKPAEATRISIDADFEDVNPSPDGQANGPKRSDVSQLSNSTGSYTSGKSALSDKISPRVITKKRHDKLLINYACERKFGDKRPFWCDGDEKFDEHHIEEGKVVLDAIQQVPFDDDMAAELVHISWLQSNEKKYEDMTNYVPYKILDMDLKLHYLANVRLMKALICRLDDRMRTVAEGIHDKWREDFDAKNPGGKSLRKTSDGEEHNFNVPLGLLPKEWMRDYLLLAVSLKVGDDLFAKRVAETNNPNLLYEFYHEDWRKRPSRIDTNKRLRKPFRQLSELDKLKYKELHTLYRSIESKLLVRMIFA